MDLISPSVYIASVRTGPSQQQSSEYIKLSDPMMLFSLVVDAPATENQLIPTVMAGFLWCGLPLLVCSFSEQPLLYIQQ